MWNLHLQLSIYSYLLYGEGWNHEASQVWMSTGAGDAPKCCSSLLPNPVAPIPLAPAVVVAPVCVPFFAACPTLSQTILCFIPLLVNRGHQPKQDNNNRTYFIFSRHMFMFKVPSVTDRWWPCKFAMNSDGFPRNKQCWTTRSIGYCLDTSWIGTHCNLQELQLTIVKHDGPSITITNQPSLNIMTHHEPSIMNHH